MSSRFVSPNPSLRSGPGPGSAFRVRGRRALLKLHVNDAQWPIAWALCPGPHPLQFLPFFVPLRGGCGVDMYIGRGDARCDLCPSVLGACRCEVRTLPAFASKAFSPRQREGLLDHPVSLAPELQRECKLFTLHFSLLPCHH